MVALWYETTMFVDFCPAGVPSSLILWLTDAWLDVLLEIYELSAEDLTFVSSFLLAWFISTILLKPAALTTLTFDFEYL